MFRIITGVISFITAAFGVIAGLVGTITQWGYEEAWLNFSIVCMCSCVIYYIVSSSPLASFKVCKLELRNKILELEIERTRLEIEKRDIDKEFGAGRDNKSK